METRTTWKDLLDVSQSLREIYFLEFKDPAVDIAQLLTVNSSDSAEEKDLTAYTVGDMENVGEGGATPYDDEGEGYATVYAHATYKKGITITREAIDDNKYRNLVNQTKGVAKTARYTPLMYAAKFYNNAFTVNPAGYAAYNNGALALCSASQTYENGDSGTQSNYSTNVLNYDNFDTGMVALNTQRDSDGRLIAFTGKPKLIVGPTLLKMATEITESELDPDTANNAINVYKGAVADVIVNPWMHTSGGATYNTCWFLVAPDNKLNFFWRVKPEFSEEKDFDSDVIKHKVYARWSAGFSDWRGCYGSIGTT